MDSNSEIREYDWHGAMMVRRWEDRLPNVAKTLRQRQQAKQNVRAIEERYETHNDGKRHKMGDMLKGFAQAEMKRIEGGVPIEACSEPLAEQRVEDFPDHDPETGCLWTHEKRQIIKKYNNLRAAGQLGDSHTYLTMPSGAAMVKKADKIINKENAQQFFSTVRPAQGSANGAEGESLGFAIPPEYDVYSPGSYGGQRLSHHDPIQHLFEDYAVPMPAQRVRAPLLSVDSTHEEVESFLQLPPEAPENRRTMKKKTLSNAPGDIKREAKRVRDLYEGQVRLEHEEQMAAWRLTGSEDRRVIKPPADPVRPAPTTTQPPSISGSNNPPLAVDKAQSSGAHKTPRTGKSKGKRRAAATTARVELGMTTPPTSNSGSSLPPVAADPEEAVEAHTPPQTVASKGRKRAAPATLSSEPPRKSGRTIKLTVRAQEAKDIAEGSKCIDGARA